MCIFIQWLQYNDKLTQTRPQLMTVTHTSQMRHYNNEAWQGVGTTPTQDKNKPTPPISVGCHSEQNGGHFC